MKKYRRIKKRKYKITLKDLLTEEDIKKMINVADNIRNKAFISLLYESGCKIGEMLSIKIKDIIFDEFGFIISIGGMKQRQIRIIE